MSDTVGVDSDLLNRLMGGHFSSVMGTLGWVLQLVYSVMTILSFVALIINITKLAKSSGNPAGRSQALHGILVSGICISILGGIGLVYVVLLTFMA